MELNAIATALIMSALGFEPADRCTINQKLSRLSPSGGTALRDSVETGLGLILRLNAELNKLGTGEVWNFLHIVITDGEDTSSETSLEELGGIFYLVGRTIPTSRCKTAFIGIELNNKELAELAVLSALGGDNCDLYNANNVSLNEIFQRISVNVGLQRQVGIVGVQTNNMSALMFQQRNSPVLQIRRNRFAVLLNLDFSGSMEGKKWQALRNSVAAFLRNLQDGDLVSCVLFNGQVHNIGKFG
ncbi:unnamed protein product [Blepharisma stoltei]|uniref:VWFA domain-containing protein n=1 Tax=Blepharisma stoltei TaxID=1481888 RepID=A0AAU9IVQ3_9CILI|nr:unnamed protein product [Blepharisma stoltei]